MAAPGDVRQLRLPAAVAAPDRPPGVPAGAAEPAYGGFPGGASRSPGAPCRRSGGGGGAASRDDPAAPGRTGSARSALPGGLPLPGDRPDRGRARHDGQLPLARGARPAAAGTGRRRPDLPEPGARGRLAPLDLAPPGSIDRPGSSFVDGGGWMVEERRTNDE